MATNETKLPAIPPIPSNTDPQLKTYLSALDEVLKVRLGRTGDPKDRAVTVRELIDTGLAENFKENPFDPNAGTPENTFIPTERVDITLPPDVTSFAGVGAFQKIILSWDLAQFSNFAFTEVWRHTSNSIGDATRIDTTRAQVYADTVDYGANFYYWVRHVSTSNIVGQFTSGVNVTTSKIASSNVTDAFSTGALTAAQIATGTITAASGVIADAAITTAKIDDAAITNAKINDLDAGKINAGSLNVARITDDSLVIYDKGTAGTVGSTSAAGGSEVTLDGTSHTNSVYVGQASTYFSNFYGSAPYQKYSSTVLSSTSNLSFNPVNGGSFLVEIIITHDGQLGGSNIQSWLDVYTVTENTGSYDTATDTSSSTLVAQGFQHRRIATAPLLTSVFRFILTATAGKYYYVRTYSGANDVFFLGATAATLANARCITTPSISITGLFV
tara:strand:- start:645 stop:1979 length:1335 start_codon:yes stop_codon:yes gene_type:complete